MTLGSDIAAALPGLRAEADSMMVSTGVVRRGTGVMVEDPDTRQEVEETIVIYAGVCRFKAANSQAGESDIPGAVVVDQGATLSLPVGAPGAGDVRLNDVWECVANPFDPSLVGRKARVTGRHTQTYATAIRLPVEEIS